LSGDYNVLDTVAMRHGVRLETWRGWGWKFPEKRVLFEERKPMILDAVHQQLAGFRIFTANLGAPRRILERLESAIMKTLDKQPPPFCDLPDQGMWLARRASPESPISASNQCAFKLHGLPECIEI
jgi:hypothetical protein